MGDVLGRQDTPARHAPAAPPGEPIAGVGLRSLPSPLRPNRATCAGLEVVVRRHVEGPDGVWRGPSCWRCYDARGRTRTQLRLQLHLGAARERRRDVRARADFFTERTPVSIAAAIFSQNHGEADSVAVLGRRRGLPEAISGNNDFWRWGPPMHADGSVVVHIGGEVAVHRESFASVTAVDTLAAPLAMPSERGLSVCVGRGLRRKLAEAWGGRDITIERK